MLGIPVKGITRFEITNTEMPPEEIGKKFCRLDINMVVNDKRVNLEIQIEDQGNYPERTLFNWSRIFSSAIPSGEDYALLPRTIIISIMGFILFECKEVYSQYRVLEVRRHTPLTDKMDLYYFELPKLPKIEDIDKNNEKELWLALFNAETEEELNIIEGLGVSVMSQAIQAYRNVSATDEFRNLETMREKTRHDEAQAIRNAILTERKRLHGVIEKKDAVLAETNAVLMETNAALAEKDAEIERLRLQILNLQT